MKAEVYYWKDIKWLLELGAKDKPEHPTKEQIKTDYVKLPVKFEIESGDEKKLDKIYATLNTDKNPMATSNMQKWIKDNELTHTSMSVGDIIRTKKGMYICKDFGWEKVA